MDEEERWRNGIKEREKEWMKKRDGERVEEERWGWGCIGRDGGGERYVMKEGKKKERRNG
jgi:hypothetical protein